MVGVLHSTSIADFTTPTPMNNADYTGISIADDSSQFTNWGVADAANPNAASEFSDGSAAFLVGSAYTVLNDLKIGSVSLWSMVQAQYPAAAADINNLYIHIFFRNDNYPSLTACQIATCSNLFANDRTVIVNANAPTSQQPGIVPAIPVNDSTLLTERAYLLAPPPGTVAGPGVAPSLLTGSAEIYLQAPYIVCDATQSGCHPLN